MIKRGLLLLVLIVLATTMQAGAQKIAFVKLSANQIPSQIKYEGKVKDAYRFTNGSGDHLVITTETGSYTNKKLKDFEDGKDARLYAYHFLVKNGKTTLVWKVFDLIQDCPFDIYLKFIRNSFGVTDLNKDGIAEVWLMYKKSCKSDVSPLEMKIIMYEGQRKFALRGENKVDLGGEKFMGGKYKFDDAFLTGPSEFKAYASSLWQKNILETWSN